MTGTGINGELDGKVALVTGAVGGIGAAVVERFRRAGAQVAGIDLVAGGGADLDLVADLRSDAEVGEAHRRAVETLGPVDLVVHAGARSVPGGCLDTAPADFADLYDVNVIGAVRLLRACVPGMQARGAGAFVLLSSINADFATPTLAAYAATKAALNSLTRTAALELAPDGIRVNAIAPASVDTPLLRSSFAAAADLDAAIAANVRRHPLGRWGKPAEVAELALFLASDRAAWITGTVQRIDGGAGVTRR